VSCTAELFPDTIADLVSAMEERCKLERLAKKAKEKRRISLICY